MRVVREDKMGLLSGRRGSKRQAYEIADKVNKRSKIMATMAQSKTKKGNLLDKINLLKSEVSKAFKNTKDDYGLITTEEELSDYIDKANSNGLLVLDTETSGLDPITDIIAGACFYTEGKKPVYTPVNHVSFISGERLKNQIDPEILKKHLKRLEPSTKTIYHNAKFDLRVFKNQLDLDMFQYLWWDTMIAAVMLDEVKDGKTGNKLKELVSYYLTGEKEYNFSELFKDVPFQYIPIEYAYLYAAGDAKKTYDLYKFQEPYLTVGHEKCKNKDLEGVAEYYQKIEIPLIDVLANMEDRGCEIDLDAINDLSKELEKKIKSETENFYKNLEPYKQEIKKYRLKNSHNCKLDNPIKLTSPLQLSILFYDIIGIDSVDKKAPKGTGAEVIEKLKARYKDDQNILNLVKPLSNLRHYEKLKTSYVDSIPKLINKKTGKLHTEFTQHITRTGRLSSRNPNFQNMPVKTDIGKKIRQAFKAAINKVFLFADYSKQEPGILAHVTQDENLLDVFKTGKDVYSFMGSFTYKVPYEACLEFNEDGSVNKEGKRRRSDMKAIVLGIMYEKTAQAIAEDLKISLKEAKKILDKFFKAFPKVKDFREEQMSFVKENGFVEMVGGRKARIPDMMLPKYSIERISEGSNFDPLDGLDDLDTSFDDSDLTLDDETYEEYWTAMEKSWRFKDKMAVIERAREEGISIIDNSKKIEEATRQVINSIIQGSAGVCTKNAMVSMNAERTYQLHGRPESFYKKLEPYLERSKRLSEIGFEMFIQIHDELGSSVNENHAKEGRKIKESIMLDSVTDLLTVQLSVDFEISKRWTGEKIEL